MVGGAYDMSSRGCGPICHGVVAGARIHDGCWRAICRDMYILLDPKTLYMASVHGASMVFHAEVLALHIIIMPFAFVGSPKATSQRSN